MHECMMTNKSEDGLESNVKEAESEIGRAIKGVISYASLWSCTPNESRHPKINYSDENLLIFVKENTCC